MPRDAGQLGIRHVDLRIVEIGLVDPVRALSGTSRRGMAPEVAEGGDMGLGPRVLVQVEDRADERVPHGSTITEAQIRCRLPVFELLHWPRGRSPSGPPNPARCHHARPRCGLVVSSGSVACTQRRNEEIDTSRLRSSRSRWWIVETVTIPSRFLM